MPITQVEANQIAANIDPIFQQVLNEYDFRKYPPEDYERFKTSFSALNNPNDDIEGALIWKWGHWRKPNYPQRHRNLVAEVQRLWPEFVTARNTNTSGGTFQWWRTALVSQTRYITVAYITHLVHYREPLPIIDQHNFRAMNALIGCLRPGHRATKKPSNWNDIISLKNFMSLICNVMPGRSFAELDRFLMMYGRNHAAR